MLSASKPVSPVEPRFTHAYYSPEALKAEDILQKLNSSAHLNDGFLKPVYHSSNNFSESKRSSTHSSIASSVQSSIPPVNNSSRQSSGYSSAMSALPNVNGIDAHKSRTSSRTRTPQQAEPAIDGPSKKLMQNSLVIPMAMVGLNSGNDDEAEPMSASSMTTNTPWDNEPHPFRNDEEKSSHNPDPATRNPSPFIAALQRATSPQSQRSGTSTPKSPSKALPKDEQQEHNVTALGFYQRTDTSPVIIVQDGKLSSPVSSRHPTADPTRKPPVRGLLPPDSQSSALRPRSTGW
jgi:hypothetical protein